MIQRRVLALALTSLYACAAAQTTCSNEFIPVHTGWTWNYRMTAADGKVYSYSEQRRPSAEGYASVIQRQANPEPQRQEFRCQDGSYVGTSPPSLGGGIEITKASYKGTGLPPAPWKIGQTWESAWLLEGKRGLLRGTGSIEFKGRVVGRETVNVPAGKFDTWKVEGQQRQEGKVAGIPLKAPGMTYTIWYAEGVGMVKVDYAQGAKVELISLDKK